MHRQIGNAVAWPVSNALGRELTESLFRDWMKSWEDAIVIE